MATTGWYDQIDKVKQLEAAGIGNLWLHFFRLARISFPFRKSGNLSTVSQYDIMGYEFTITGKDSPPVQPRPDNILLNNERKAACYG
jgi:hypothetical protein